jgi:hypothetical protein
MTYQHDDAEAFVAWFLSPTTAHLQTLRESLHANNVPDAHWPDVSGRLTARLADELSGLRQRVLDGTARQRPSDFVRVDEGALRLAQQKQQILENETAARRQRQKGTSRR